MVGLLVVVGARVAGTEVEAAVTVSLMSSGSGGETGGEVEDGGGLRGVGDAQVGHLSVEMTEGIRIGGESQLNVVGDETCATGGLDLVAIVGKLLEVETGVLPGLLDDWTHAPALAGFGHEVACVHQVVEAVSFLVVIESCASNSKSITAFLNLLDDKFQRTTFPRDIHARGDFSAFGFGESAVGDFHMMEKFTDGSGTVEEEILTEKTPVDFVAAV